MPKKAIANRSGKSGRQCKCASRQRNKNVEIRLFQRVAHNGHQMRQRVTSRPADIVSQFRGDLCPEKVTVPAAQRVLARFGLSPKLIVLASMLDRDQGDIMPCMAAQLPTNSDFGPHCRRGCRHIAIALLDFVGMGIANRADLLENAEK
jgi:hypothetical protein